MRTLVISDLHLGNRGRRDVLRGPLALGRLLDALGDVQRLVLLGDCAELVTRHPRRPLAAAEPVLRAIGGRMARGVGREIVIVPGNHDAPLVRAWVRARGAALTVSSPVDPRVTRALHRVVSWLGPVPVRVSYPGVWLSQRVYSTHGHYLDRHLIPDSAVGLPTGSTRASGARSHPTGGLRARPPARPEPRHGARARARAAAGRGRRRRGTPGPRPVMPRLGPLLMNAGLAPIAGAMLDAQMRHAALPALGRVVSRLGIDPTG